MDVLFYEEEAHSFVESIKCSKECKGYLFLLVEWSDKICRWEPFQMIYQNNDVLRDAKNFVSLNLKKPKNVFAQRGQLFLQRAALVHEVTDNAHITRRRLRYHTGQLSAKKPAHYRRQISEDSRKHCNQLPPYSRLPTCFS